MKRTRSAKKGKSQSSKRRRWTTTDDEKLVAQTTLRRWTTTEDEKLVELHKKYDGDPKQIAEELGDRTEWAVYGRMKKLKMTEPGGRRWTTTDDEKLVELDKKYDGDPKQIAEELGDRTEQAVYGRMKKLKMTQPTGRRWTTTDDEKLVELDKKYDGDPKRIAEAFEDRTKRAVYGRMKKLKDVSAEPCAPAIQSYTRLRSGRKLACAPPPPEVTKPARPEPLVQLAEATADKLWKHAGRHELRPSPLVISQVTLGALRRYLRTGCN